MNKYSLNCFVQVHLFHSFLQVPKEPEVERIPSWKKVLRRSSENIESPGSEVAEVTLKRPRKSEEVSIVKNCI